MKEAKALTTILSSTATIAPSFIYRKIGNTKYRVAVHFSDTSRERMEDKIMRLAENDLNYTGLCPIIKSPQTGRLLEGGSL